MNMPWIVEGIVLAGFLWAAGAVIAEGLNHTYKPASTKGPIDVVSGGLMFAALVVSVWSWWRR